MVNGDFKAFLSLKDFWIDEFTDTLQAKSTGCLKNIVSHFVAK